MSKSTDCTNIDAGKMELYLFGGIGEDKDSSAIYVEISVISNGIMV